MNGEAHLDELDGIKLKKSVNMPVRIANGHTDGPLDDSNDNYEDPSNALQLLKTYAKPDGISIQDVS